MTSAQVQFLLTKYGGIKNLYKIYSNNARVTLVSDDMIKENRVVFDHAHEILEILEYTSMFERAEYNMAWMVQCIPYDMIEGMWFDNKSSALPLRAEDNYGVLVITLSTIGKLNGKISDIASLHPLINKQFMKSTLISELTTLGYSEVDQTIILSYIELQ